MVTKKAIFTFRLVTTGSSISGGDIFKVSALETWVLHGGGSYENVTQWTNYEYFVLTSGINRIETNFSGAFKILNYQELFK